MCEIFFIRAMGDRKEIGEEALRRVLFEAHTSAKIQKDGWGIFNENRTWVKSPETFKFADIQPLVELYSKSKFIVLHLRLSTSNTVCMEHTHPFVVGKNLLVHNGICHVDGQEKTQVDSEALLQAIVRQEGEDGVAKIVNLFKNNDAYGSFSVFFYDDTDALYYFRDVMSFEFRYYPDLSIIAGATSRLAINSMFTKQIYGFEKKDRFVSLDPKNETVYSISDDGIYVAGEFNNHYAIGVNYSDPYVQCDACGRWHSARFSCDRYQPFRHHKECRCALCKAEILRRKKWRNEKVDKIDKKARKYQRKKAIQEAKCEQTAEDSALERFYLDEIFGGENSSTSLVSSPDQSDKNPYELYDLTHCYICGVSINDYGYRGSTSCKKCYKTMSRSCG